MNWVLSDTPSYKVGNSLQHTIIKRNWYVQDWTEAGFRGTSKLSKEVAQMPMVSTPLFFFFLNQFLLNYLLSPILVHLALWGVL